MISFNAMSPVNKMRQLPKIVSQTNIDKLVDIIVSCVRVQEIHLKVKVGQLDEETDRPEQ